MGGGGRYREQEQNEEMDDGREEKVGQRGRWMDGASDRELEGRRERESRLKGELIGERGGAAFQQSEL